MIYSLERRVLNATALTVVVFCQKKTFCMKRDNAENSVENREKNQCLFSNRHPFDLIRHLRYHLKCTARNQWARGFG